MLFLWVQRMYKRVEFETCPRAGLWLGASRETSPAALRLDFVSSFSWQCDAQGTGVSHLYPASPFLPPHAKS